MCVAYKKNTNITGNDYIENHSQKHNSKFVRRHFLHIYLCASIKVTYRKYSALE